MTVRTESAAVAGMATHWPMIRAVTTGTAAMREGGEKFLPRWPNEDQDSYKSRLAVATLYPAFARTVSVMASKPFSKSLTFSEDTSPRILEWSNDIDLQGRNLHSFMADVMTDCMGYGVSGVLVDFPKADGIRTKADEQSAGIRPYFTRYAPGTVLGWRCEKMAGADVLTQLRLLENVIEHEGEFGEKSVEQVRVLTPGAWQIYRKTDGKEDWFLFDEGTTTIQAIPFVFFYGIRQGFGVGLPPLLELAFQNVEHWQSGSDQQTILHVARVPILTIIGAEDDTQITVGASSAVKLPIGADMRFVEHSGAAIAAGRESIKDLEERMRQTGAELLVFKPGLTTATQVTSENEANKCTLQRITEIFEDAIDQCLFFMAAWVNEPLSGHCTLFKDFGAATLSDASAQLLLQANQAGKLSDESLMTEWKRRGILSPDMEWEDEQDRISDQGPALGLMGENDPVIHPPEPEPVQPEPVDLSPVLEAIKAIKLPEPIEPEAKDDSELLASIADLSKRVDTMAAVESVQPEPVDLAPITEAIAELSAKVEAPQPTYDDSAIKAQIAALSEQVATLAAKPEPALPDVSAIINQAIANLPKQAQPVMLIDPQTGAVKKQITLTYGDDGRPNGAVVEGQT